MTGTDTLLRQVRACTLCAHDLPMGPRPVVQLHPNAQILLAGQAPGRRVHLSGIPFDDPSGDRLRAWMAIDRDTFYDPQQLAILPMGFCYPGTGKSGDLPPRKECAPAWRDQLLQHLPNLKLTLVIGQYAIAYHIPDRAPTLTQTVQNWQTHWPNLLPLPHPSPRNNLWLRRNPWFEAQIIPALQQRIHTILHPRQT